MTALAARTAQTTVAARLASRSDLTAFFMGLTDEIGADGYMLVAISHDQDRDNLQIIASNWIYDAIQMAGHALIAGLAQSPYASAPGVRPQSLVASQAPALLGGEEARLLEVLGQSSRCACKSDASGCSSCSQPPRPARSMPRPCRAPSSNAAMRCRRRRASSPPPRFRIRSPTASASACSGFPKARRRRTWR